MTLEQIISIKGEPDEVVICDPTRGNESEGVVLIYKPGNGQKGELIYEGTSISLASIVDITVKNIAIVYIPNDYSLLITTTDKEVPTLRIHTGNDALWAEDVCRQLIACIENIGD